VFIEGPPNKEEGEEVFDSALETERECVGSTSAMLHDPL